MVSQGKVRVQRKRAALSKPATIIVKADLPSIAGQNSNQTQRPRLAIEPDFQFTAVVALPAHEVYQESSGGERPGTPFGFADVRARCVEDRRTSNPRSWSFRPTVSSAASRLKSFSRPKTANTRR